MRTVPCRSYVYRDVTAAHTDLLQQHADVNLLKDVGGTKDAASGPQRELTTIHNGKGPAAIAHELRNAAFLWKCTVTRPTRRKSVHIVGAPNAELCTRIRPCGVHVEKSINDAACRHGARAAQYLAGQVAPCLGSGSFAPRSFHQC